MKNKKALAPIFIVLIVIGILIIGVGGYFLLSPSVDPITDEDSKGDLINNSSENTSSNRESELCTSGPFNTKIIDRLPPLVIEYDSRDFIEYISGDTNENDDVILDRCYGYDSNPPLEGIEGLTCVEDLSFNLRCVNDLTPLSNLKNLKSLNLAFTPVSDLTPLSGLSNLQELHIYGTNVNDLTPLSGLSNLQELSIFYTNISDLAPLSNLNLGYISLDGSLDLTPLKNMETLKMILIYSDDPNDVAPLMGLDLEQVSFIIPGKSNANKTDIRNQLKIMFPNTYIYVI